MNVLIYTGYQKEAYNSNTLKEKGLGGTEQCCIYLAKYLKNFGWNIIIGGDVIEDTVDSIQWMRLETVHKKMYDKFSCNPQKELVRKYGLSKIMLESNNIKELFIELL